MRSVTKTAPETNVPSVLSQQAYQIGSNKICFSSTISSGKTMGKGSAGLVNVPENPIVFLIPVVFLIPARDITTFQAQHRQNVVTGLAPVRRNICYTEA
jgi:hypothetical protein